MICKSILIILAVVIIYIEAGVITNSFGSNLNTSLTGSYQNIDKDDRTFLSPKKYRNDNLTPDDHDKVLDNRYKFNSFNKTSILKNIPQNLSDGKESRFEFNHAKNTVDVIILDDKIDKAEIVNNSAEEILEFDLYPNIFKEVINTSIKNVSHNSQNTDFLDRSNDQHRYKEITDIKEVNTVNKGGDITINQFETVVTSENITEIISEKPNFEKNLTTASKYENKGFPEKDNMDFDEFIFINDEDYLQDFTTDPNDNYFDRLADIFLDEMRFKRAANIIEEENMSTTALGLKYTGGPKILNNDLYYKNINV